jgi:hypothetical protein
VRFPAIEKLVGAVVGTAIGGGTARRQWRCLSHRWWAGLDLSGGGRSHGEEEDGRAEEDVAVRRRTRCSHAEEEIAQ